MSSFVQRSPASERNEEVWRPIIASRPFNDNFASSAAQAKFPDEQIKYAATASRHIAKDKQAMSHTSHLSDDLHSLSDHRAEKNDRLSPASHSRNDLASKSGDASSNAKTSLLENTKLRLKESNAPKTSSLDLTKANFYQKKPPILSPKPNVLPKPKAFEFSPNAVGEKNQSASSEDLKRFSQSNRKTSFQTQVSTKTPVESRTTYRGRSQSVEEDSFFDTSGENIRTAQISPSGVSAKVKRSQTLPRFVNNANGAMRLGMESAKSCINSNAEKLSVKNPPKIPAKPKMKQNLSPGNRVANGKPNPDKSLIHVDPNDPSFVPFSEMRSKFEDMKIKFKKPIPDPDFRPPPSNSVGPTITKNLFKDILEMKSLEHFEQVASENAQQSPENFQKSIRSARTVQSKHPQQRPNCDSNNRMYSPADVPAPTKMKNDDLHQIDFMDLPPPPELPPTSGYFISNETKLSDAAKSSAANLERNLTTQESAAYHHNDRQPAIAPGLAKRNVQSLETMSGRSESSISNNNNKNSQLSGKPVKVENPSNQKRSGVSNRNISLISDNEPRLGEKSGLISDKIAQPNITAPQNAQNSKYSVTPPSRSFDEEILYYDNMDIMEKVRQKREHDDLRLKKLSQHQNSNSFSPKKSVDRTAKENKNPTAQSPHTPHRLLSDKITNSVKPSRFDVFDGNSENRNAGRVIEKDNSTLKDDKNELVQGPPKLPPKQLKFNRKQAIKSAEEQSPDKENHLSHSNVSAISHQPLRIQIESSPVHVSTSPHVATPIPTQKALGFNALLHTPEEHSLQQPQALLEQMTLEDARARQLVDEPLAPIMEEDSTYGDSSSCASSITGDDTSVFAETSSLPSSDLHSAYSNQPGFGFGQKKHYSCFGDEQDGGTTETDSTFAEKDSLQSSSSIEDDSDASSVQWQENPLQTNRQASTVPSSHTNNGPLFAVQKTASAPQRKMKVEKAENEAQAVLSSTRNRHTTRESKSSESSGPGTKSAETSKSSFGKNAEEIEDVAPYGMVDLSKLEPTFQTANCSQSSGHSDVELTPSSIMLSVNQFNATRVKSPTKSGSFSFDEASDMPTFPLDVDVGMKQSKNNKKSPKHQRSKSDADLGFEQPGYDNLEKYGGASREAAQRKQKIREASLPAKYTQPPAPTQSNDNSRRKLLERRDVHDSLTSEPGLERQVAGSRASVPLPATVARLARHSSAVRAVDRHSGNLKRAKESGALDSFHKSSSNRVLDKKAFHSSTLSGSHESDAVTKDKLEANRAIIINKEDLRTKNASVDSKEKTRIPGGKHELNDELPSDFDERQDDAIVNPYEEVPFILSSKGQQVISSIPESAEQVATKSKVKEIMENVKPSESAYRPKPPVPRYPVDYDNFYLGKDSPALSKSSNTSANEEFSKTRSPTFPNSSTPVSSPVNVDKSIGYSDASVTPSSTPAMIRAAASRASRSSKNDHESNVSIPSQDEDASCNASDAGSRSIGSQLRYFLGGGQDSKHVSPSVRRKRSLLKRSKSPGGSRRSKSPSKSIGTGEEQSSSSGGAMKPGKETSNDELDTRNQSGKSSETESRENVPPRRSASQRLVDRRGRAAPQRPKTSEDESSEQTLNRRKKEKLRMSSRWRRSKSQDRGESPTRSKSKERKIFGRRSKSQERPGDKDSKEVDTGDEERSGRKFLRRSRSSSRKRDKRGRSSERTDDGNSSGGRGRNPVKFFRKLLRSKKSDEDIEIIHSTHEKGGDLTDSTEALSTILAYKGEEGTEKEEWNPPRPNPPQQRINKLNDKKSKPSTPTKTNKALKSPPSHRAKKFTSSHVTKTRTEISTDSSSEGIDKKKSDRNKMMPSHGNFVSRPRASPPQKPMRASSRKSSFSNSLPSSDSEPFNKRENKQRPFENLNPREDLTSNRNQFPLKSGGLRRNLLLNRDYDSDTATSVLASDVDSSAGTHSDFDSNNPANERPIIKPRKSDRQFQTTDMEAPKRPVRIISPQRSKSDPNIFPVSSATENEPPSTYYNIKENAKIPTTVNTPDPKRPVKQHGPNRRRNQKQNRRQTAPVDLAYEAHQRQKYKTLVSLNAQTLRKVTEKWLSEWRNQLPVGGFLITSWSDVALSSHKPMCMIANSVVYSAVSTGSKQFHLACQLYDNADVDDRMIRKLDNCSSLPAHPNTCGVCSHFNCRVPRSLLDPSSGGGAADAVCVVLTTRPHQSLQDFLDRLSHQEDPSELHRQVLVNILQLLHGIQHLQASGFDLPHISAEHLVITEDRGFLQILPHLYCSDPRRWRNVGMDSSQSSDSDTNFSHQRRSITQQVGNLIKLLLQNGILASTIAPLSRQGERRSTSSAIVVPATKYSAALKHIIRHLETTPSLSAVEASHIIQCALWGPEDLEDVGVDDVSPYAALELWIEMEQAKLVNSLAVLASNDRLVPFSFLKHQYFASVTPQSLFSALKVLQRI